MSAVGVVFYRVATSPQTRQTFKAQNKGRRLRLLKCTKTGENVTMQNALIGVFSVYMLTVQIAAPAKECGGFVASLDTCTPYKCIFVHPFTGERMERRIIEYKSGKCSYTEQMPKGGRMDCAYSDSLRKAISKYYKDVDAAAAAGKSVGSTVHMTTGKVETRYTIDGKEVSNPLQEALRIGQCKVTGYGLQPRSDPKKK